MRYMLHATAIVGYTFNADTLCCDCVRELAIGEALKAGSATMWGDSGTSEDTLGEWASLIGLDRADESSFDSGEFPKVIFASMVEADERCGACHESLIGE